MLITLFILGRRFASRPIHIYHQRNSSLNQFKKHQCFIQTLPDFSKCLLQQRKHMKLNGKLKQLIQITDLNLQVNRFERILLFLLNTAQHVIFLLQISKKLKASMASNTRSMFIHIKQITKAKIWHLNLKDKLLEIFLQNSNKIKMYGNQLQHQIPAMIALMKRMMKVLKLKLY